MGRIKTRLLKRATLELLREHSDKIKDNFEENKRIVSRLLDVPSKKQRNVIAGYATRLRKTKGEEK